MAWDVSNDNIKSFGDHIGLCFLGREQEVRNFFVGIQEEIETKKMHDSQKQIQQRIRSKEISFTLSNEVMMDGKRSKNKEKT